MAINIAVSSTTGTSFNVNTYLDNYPGGFNPAAFNYGVFYDGATDDSEYTQYGLQNTSTTDAFVAGSDAGDLTYTTGNLDGSLDTLSFGSGLNYTYPGSGVESTTALSLDATVLSITNLGLDDTSQVGGTGDDVHDILYGLMTGNESYLETYLAANDVAFQGANGNDTFVSGSGADTLNGGAGSDVLTGGAGADVLQGNSGTDTVDGGAGDDVVRGGTGADTLVASLGSDTLYGGANGDADTFDFTEVDTLGGVVDAVIADFEDDVNMIDLSGFGLDDTDVLAEASQDGSDVVIDLEALLSLGADATLTIEDFDLADLDIGTTAGSYDLLV